MYSNITDQYASILKDYLEQEYFPDSVLTPDEIEKIRINKIILDKHEEIVQYLKEKYPEEFI